MGGDFDTALALGGLENELALIRQRVNAAIWAQEGQASTLRDIDAELKKYEGLAGKLKEALGQHMPPFKVGQHTRVKSTGGTFIIEGIERAFGQWVCMGHFPQGYKKYTYPSSELVPYDDYEAE